MQHQRKAVPTESLDPALTEVSRQVIGASIEIHKTLGPGFDRSVYVGALTSELETAGIPYVVDHRFPVRYKDREVGQATIGLYVNNRFAVEPMAEHREIDGLDRTVLRAKLRAADLELGLIINFGERRLKDGLVRVLNPDKLEAQAAAAAAASAASSAPAEPSESIAPSEPTEPAASAPATEPGEAE